jgi:hypothetical protein
MVKADICITSRMELGIKKGHVMLSAAREIDLSFYKPFLPS